MPSESWTSENRCVGSASGVFGCQRLQTLKDARIQIEPLQDELLLCRPMSVIVQH